MRKGMDGSKRADDKCFGRKLFWMRLQRTFNLSSKGGSLWNTHSVIFRRSHKVIQTVLVLTHPSYSMSYSPLSDMEGENQQIGVIKTQIYNVLVGQPDNGKKVLSVIMWQIKN